MPKKLTFEQEALEDLDQHIEKVMADWKVPGLAVAIVKKDKIIYSKGFGYKNLEKKLPVTEDTNFAIGSVTKSFTGLAVSKLVDEGKLDFDKPVRDYIPEFKMYDPYVSNHMTARDLLTHVSGLPRHDLVWYASNKDRKQLMDSLQYLEPSEDFRSTWQYQNLMFMVAGVLVEKVTDNTWEQYIKENIFQPLEMKSSILSFKDIEKQENYALPYKNQKDKVIKTDFHNTDAIAPAGSIYSNVKDMSNWLIMQLNKGKYNDKKIISENGLKVTHTPYSIVPGQLKSKDDFYKLYGLGWMINNYKGYLLLNHGGNIDGFSAMVSLLPREEYGIVVLTNMDGSVVPVIIQNNIQDRLLDLFQVNWNSKFLNKVREAEKAMAENKEDTRKVKNTKYSHDIKDYTGKFMHPAYGTLEITLKDNQLQAKFNNLESPLRHFHYDIFEATESLFDKTKLVFHTNIKGEIDRVSSAIQNGVDEIVFKRKIEKIELSKEILEKYAGTYQIINVSLTISIKDDGTLAADVPGQPQYTLIPIKKNEFILKDLDGFGIIFNTDKNGNVTEASIIQPNGTFKAKKDLA